MRANEIAKRQDRRTVGDHAGKNLDFSRPWEDTQRLEQLQAEALRLTVAADAVVDLNTSDGSLIFVPGISDPAGTDVIT